VKRKKHFSDSVFEAAVHFTTIPYNINSKKEFLII
jgi:hypothetical protein